MLTVLPCCMVSSQHMNVGPMTASTAAAKIVKSVKSFYQVNINRTLLTEQLIVAFSNQLSELAGQPLSPEAYHYLYEQLQGMQLQNR